MTDWGKVFEVFGSGIIGVFVVMVLLQWMTRLTSWVIERVENWHCRDKAEAASEADAAQKKSAVASNG